MIEMGVSYDRDSDGELILGLEGGHSHRRILHADGDATGKVMTDFMLRKILDIPRIKAFEYTTAVRIITQNEMCCGIQTLDFKTGENALFRTKATILATGGLSRIYERSTNPYTATGDGIALAWQAGAKMADMEFIQFHPTALSVDGEDAYLISEAVRGEGAQLFDKNGVRFMVQSHPMAELAPRDVVASAIFKRMQETESTVFLSLKHLDANFLKERFHSIDAKLKGFGIDLTNDSIPISPAAHYTVGGIQTDLWGQTNISGLFACGEVASTGVMGANRLASNSLLECLVFGKRLVEKAKKLKQPQWDSLEVHEMVLNRHTEAKYLGIKNELSHMMTSQVGLVRNEKDMSTALQRINSILEEFTFEMIDYNLQKINALANVCKLICVSAMNRKESRGGHVRSDFRDESKEFVHHIIQQKGKEISSEEVRKNKVQ